MTDPVDQIPVLLVVDVEPDHHVFDLNSPSPWDAFGLLVARLSALRTQLEDRTGRPVHFSWALRMDPQIAAGYGSATYVVDRFGDLISQLVDAGDEMGIHPHAWRWKERESEWVSDHTDQSWLDECLDLNVESYRSAFGTPPPHHRFGAAHMSSATMRRVGHHGIPVDLTVEPGVGSAPDGVRLGGRFAGGTGDFRDIPGSRYRPDRQDYRKCASTDEAGPLAIPLTSGVFAGRSSTLSRQTRHPLTTARYALRALAEPVSYLRSRTRPGGRRELLGMWKDWSGPSEFWDAAFVAADQVTPRYLAFAVRCDCGLDTATGRRFAAIMERLLVDPRAQGLHFVTPTEAAADLGQPISG